MKVECVYGCLKTVLYLDKGGRERETKKKASYQFGSVHCYLPEISGNEGLLLTPG